MNVQSREKENSLVEAAALRRARHASFRELLRSGFRDAALAQARGHVNTFPSQVPWPRIELDHIMAATRESASGSAAEPARAVAFSGVESFVVEDTDHLALTATMTI